jgi:polyisoprenoid-binding protein YceI
MKKLFLFSLILLSFTIGSAQNKTWNIDKAHTGIIFNVSHMVISEVSGYFREFDGTVVTTGDDFENAVVDITIKTASINTDNEQRDKHLRSADFFDAEKFPLITYKSKSFNKTDDGMYVITGDFTMKGVTKEVKLKAKLNGIMIDPYGNKRSGWKAVTVINRYDYGVLYNSTLEGGGLAVGKEVSIIINAEFIQKK